MLDYKESSNKKKTESLLNKIIDNYEKEKLVNS